MKWGRKDHILCQRYEDDVEQEHGRRSSIVLHDVPAVILASHLVSALAPVVEGQTGSPDNRDSHDVVQSCGWQAIDVGPHIIMHVVDDGQDTPEPVHLRVVAIDLRHGEDDGRYKQRKGQRCHQRIGRGIDGLQRLQVGDVCGDLVRQVVELRQEWLHGFAEVGTFLHRLDEGQGRIEVGAGVGHDGGWCWMKKGRRLAEGRCVLCKGSQ